MTSDRGVPNVVVICGINSGERVVLSPVEVVEAGVVLPIKQTPIVSGVISEIPVTCPVVTGKRPEGHTKTSMRLVVGMTTRCVTSEPEQLLERICMIPVLMQLLESRAAGELVHLEMS
jgi:hypothetical protein